MPVYEYRCKSCALTWEEEQRITESPKETCPFCAKKTANRLISGGGFVLKGGGWFADGYAKKGGNDGKGE